MLSKAPTCSAQVSRTAPPPAGAAPATTPLECRTARRGTGSPISSPISSPRLPRPASGPGVSRLGRRWPQPCVLGSDPGPGVQVSEPLRFLASHRCPLWYQEFDPPCRLGCGFAGNRSEGDLRGFELTQLWQGSSVGQATPGSGPGVVCAKGRDGAAGGRESSPESFEFGNACKPWDRRGFRGQHPLPHRCLCPQEVTPLILHPGGPDLSPGSWGVRLPPSPDLRVCSRAGPSSPRSSQSTQNYWGSLDSPGAAHSVGRRVTGRRLPFCDRPLAVTPGRGERAIKDAVPPFPSS